MQSFSILKNEKNYKNMYNIKFNFDKIEIPELFIASKAKSHRSITHYHYVCLDT